MMPEPNKNVERLDNTIVVTGKVVPKELTDRIADELFTKYGTPKLAETSGAVLSRVIYPIARFGVSNGNSRIYEENLYTENVLTDEDVTKSLRNRNMYMQEEHPPDEGDQDKTVTSRIAGLVCDIIVPGFNDDGVYSELDLEANCAHAIVDVLNTPMGKIVDTLIQAGAGFGVSTRASGTTETIDVDGQTMDRVKLGDYKFETVDFTATPSTSNVLPTLIEKQIVERIREALDNKAISNELASRLLESCKTDGAKKLRESLSVKLLRLNEDKNMNKEKANYAALVKLDGEEKMHSTFYASTDELAEEMSNKVKDLFGKNAEVSLSPIVAETDDVEVGGDGDIAPKAEVIEPGSEEDLFKTPTLEERMSDFMESVDPSLKLSEHMVGSVKGLKKLNESMSKDKVAMKRIDHVLRESVKSIAILENERDTALELLNESLKNVNKRKDTQSVLVERKSNMKLIKSKRLAERRVLSLKKENARLIKDLDEAIKSSIDKKKVEGAVRKAISETKKVYQGKLMKLKDSNAKEIGILKENFENKKDLIRKIELRLVESGLQLPAKSVALLRESESVNELDKNLVLVKKSLREGLHSNSGKKSINITERSLQEPTGFATKGSMLKMSMLIDDCI